MLEGIKENMAVNASLANAPKESLDHRLQFFKRLQTLTNKIHGADALDQIMLDVSQDICDLFDCDRLTIYVVAPGIKSP